MRQQSIGEYIRDQLPIMLQGSSGVVCLMVEYFTISGTMVSVWTKADAETESTELTWIQSHALFWHYHLRHILPPTNNLVETQLFRRRQSHIYTSLTTSSLLYQPLRLPGSNTLYFTRAGYMGRQECLQTISNQNIVCCNGWLREWYEQLPVELSQRRGGIVVVVDDITVGIWERCWPLSGCIRTRRQFIAWYRSRSSCNSPIIVHHSVLQTLCSLVDIKRQPLIDITIVVDCPLVVSVQTQTTISSIDGVHLILHWDNYVVNIRRFITQQRQLCPVYVIVINRDFVPLHEHVLLNVLGLLPCELDHVAILPERQAYALSRTLLIHLAETIMYYATDLPVIRSSSAIIQLVSYHQNYIHIRRRFDHTEQRIQISAIMSLPASFGIWSITVYHVLRHYSNQSTALFYWPSPSMFYQPVHRLLQEHGVFIRELTIRDIYEAVTWPFIDTVILLESPHWIVDKQPLYDRLQRCCHQLIFVMVYDLYLLWATPSLKNCF